MKHIKKKTVEQFILKEQEITTLNEIFPNNELIFKQHKYKDVKDLHAVLVMKNGEKLRSYYYNDNSMACMIPIVNPVLIYFNSAQLHLKLINDSKKTLLALFRQNIDATEESLRISYDYFGMTSSFIIMLMTSIEAFINQKIPDNHICKRDEKSCTKTYNSHQIQKYFNFDEKVSEVLNEIAKKDFKKAHPTIYVYIENLKDLRNRIVHTKNGDTYNEYTDLYSRTLNFKFEKVIESVKEFLNYYEPNLIESCPCGADY